MKYIKKKIEIQKLPSGDPLNIWVYTIFGSGHKNVYIQANIHGPEVTGVIVAKKLVQYFANDKSQFKKLTIIPSCNPMGLNSQFIGQQTGYINHLSGKNWNRIYHDLSLGIEITKKFVIRGFKNLLVKNLKEKLRKEDSSESKLALTLQLLSFESDIVIDLHTAWGKAPHYVYCYKEHILEAKKFGVPNIVILDESEFLGVFDEAQLYPYFKFKEKIKNFELPKKVFTLELGSDNQLDEENINLSLVEILNFLHEKKPGDIQAVFCLNKDFVYYYAPTGGLIVWHIKCGDYFEIGQKIAEVYPIDSELPIPVVSTSKGKMIIQFNSPAIHQGQQICKVMTNIFKA